MRRRDFLALATLPALPALARGQTPHTAAGPCTGDAALCRVIDAVGRDGSNTHAVLVQRGSATLAEAYFTGRDKPSGDWFEREVAFTPDLLHDLRSISKSVTGLLAGIVLARGVLPAPASTALPALQLDRPVFDYFPEHADLATPERRQITVQHLLDMTTGWQWDEWNVSYGSLANSETRMVLATDRDRHLLDLPLAHPPGTQWAYCGGATALLGEILERLTGQGLLALAQAALFEPLGIVGATWRTGWRGKAVAFAGLRLRPRDLARIGRLMLDGGRWQGRQVVPADWVAATLASRVPAVDGLFYGRQWWHGQYARGPGAGVPFSAGLGNGGQRLFIAPSFDLVVVMTAGRYNQPGNGLPSSRLFRALLAAVQDMG